MMEDGASPYQIDQAVRDFGYPMGPFQVSDLAGGDIGWATRKRKAATRDPKARYVQIADRICERGWFGQKTGRGYYLYPEGARTGTPDPEVMAIIDAERAARRHHAAQLHRRGNHAPLHGRDDQRRRQRGAPAHRAAPARRRRDLPLRLRLPAPSRRADEVRRHAWACPRCSPTSANSRRKTRCSGSPRRCWSSWSSAAPISPASINPSKPIRRHAMREAVIVSTARTPLTKAHRGEFNITPGPTLAAFAVRAAVERSGIDPALIEDAILGCGYPEGTTGRNVGRQSHRARRPADQHRRHHGQPLLRLGPAGHRDGGGPHRGRRRAGHDRRRRREHLAASAAAAPPTAATAAWTRGSSSTSPRSTWR